MRLKSGDAAPAFETVNLERGPAHPAHWRSQHSVLSFLRYPSIPADFLKTLTGSSGKPATKTLWAIVCLYRRSNND
jgi:hypothetical protein